jgi:trehalose 6-phosphate synthase/phosphatase
MEVVEALESALTMPEKKQIECNRIMQSRLKRYNINFWARNFIEKLDIVKRHQHEIWSSKLTIEKISQLCKDYSRSKRRLILLDYDGTLISFSSEPQKVSPDIKLRRLLKELTGKRRNDVVVISGRDRNILDSFFKGINLGLVAEHGVWIKEWGNKWDMIEPLDSKWKKEILPILELYVDTTPGSFIEEKEYSLVWHYRKADTELALIRSRELNDELLNIVANLNLGIMEGNKVIEIKNAGINKGRAVLHWLPRKKYDFILAIGDDVTDEDVFTILPEWAYSIKVGLGASRARYYLTGVKDVRSLLKRLV